jgi:hypothetical protein
MIEFIRHYVQYRAVGFGRIAAFRLAMLVHSGTRRLSAH